MSELLALSHLLDKPESELTPIERAIIVASAADEDLANSAARSFELYKSSREHMESLVEKAKELKEAVYQYDAGNLKYPWITIRTLLAEFYDLL